MGQCGCADGAGRTWLYKLPGCAVSVEIYAGCEYCKTPCGVLLSFTGEGVVDTELYDVVKEVTFNECDLQIGGVALLSVDDLRAAAKEIGHVINPGDENSYISLDEWLCDNGYSLLQTAVCLCQGRTAREAQDE